jgi:hypothetical protein
MEGEIKVDAKAIQLLSSYQKDCERWIERGAHYKDIQPLTVQDVLFIRAILHPTGKADSKLVTKALIKFIVDQGIVTAQDIYKELGYSDKPILKRMKLFQQFGLIRREEKKWYIPTPRMKEIRERYLERICE